MRAKDNAMMYIRRVHALAAHMPLRDWLIQLLAWLPGTHGVLESAHVGALVSAWLCLAPAQRLQSHADMTEPACVDGAATVLHWVSLGVVTIRPSYADAVCTDRPTATCTGQAGNSYATLSAADTVAYGLPVWPVHVAVGRSAQTKTPFPANAWFQLIPISSQQQSNWLLDQNNPRNFSCPPVRVQ